MDQSSAKDVVIIGGGMAGLVAAIEALNRDKEVTILEKGDRAGGSMYLSTAGIWTYENIEDARESVPNGNPTLQQLVIDSFEKDLRWLEQLGVPLQDFENDLPYGTGKTIDGPTLTDHLVSIVESKSGDIYLQTPMTKLQTSGNGNIISVVAHTQNQEPSHIDAENVILATGGFQGNEELIEQYITDHTENLWLRSNPWSTGDGLLAAKDIGAKTTKGFDTFYGHNLLAPPAKITLHDLEKGMQKYATYSHPLALSKDGQRFTDESESIFEETLTQDTTKIADGQAYLLLDEDFYEMTNFSGEQVGSIVQQAAELGGQTIEAASLKSLGNQLTNWGVNGTQAIQTIRSYNQKIQNNCIINPPRTNDRRTFDTPPFYAIKTQAGISFTMGGLSVTKQMEVQDRARNKSSFGLDENPLLGNTIEGLYAAGADVGNIHHRHYIGGLAVALVTGRIAGSHAAMR